MRKHIPNTITSMNLLCGVVGVVFAFKGKVDIAFYLMLAGALCDFCDGLAARSLKAYSEIGRELDSLADIVTFGVLPSVMLYNVSHVCMWGESWICWTPLLLTVFSGLRLAKFNVDTRQSSGFLGLPTPACALLVGSLCYYVAWDYSCFLALWCASPVFIPVLTLCLCALLVCEIPMFSLKFHADDPAVLKNKRLAFAFIVIAAVIVCAVCRLNWSLAVLLVFICYILKNVIYAIAKI